MTSPSLSGKTILLTGATDGIGRVAAGELAKMGASLTIVGRNAQKTAETAAAIRADSGNSAIETLVGDLSSLAEVRRLAGEFLSRHNRLDVLCNNAGAIFMSRKLSTDGYEMTFALNHLSYFLLTHLLLDALKSSTAGRIVNTASDAHQGATLDLDDLQSEHGFSAYKAYGRSKLANIYFTYQLAENLKGTTVTANCLHPGFVATNFGRSNGGIFNPIFRLAQVGAIKPEEGARTIVYLASSPEVEGVSGKYFYQSRETRSSAISYDKEIARRLWDASLQLAGLPMGV